MKKFIYTPLLFIIYFLPSVHAQTYELIIGDWDYAYVRCDSPHWGQPDEAAAQSNGLNYYYGNSCPPLPSIIGSQGFPDETYPNTELIPDCGPTTNPQPYPLYKYQIAYYSEKHLLADINTGPPECGSLNPDDFRVLKVRPVKCPEGSEAFFDAVLNKYVCNKLALEPEDYGNRCEAETAGTNIGNPINVATGNKFHSENLSINKPDLPFEISYNSHKAAQSNGVIPRSIMGKGWTHSYARRMSESTFMSNGIRNIMAHRPDGRVLIFSEINGSWQGEAHNKDILLETNDGWVYTSDTLEIETYNSRGEIVGLEFPDGVVLTFEYESGSFYGFNSNNARNRLTKVSSNYNSFIEFSYQNLTSLVISKLKDHTGREWSFNYGARNELASIDFPDGTSKIYHHEHNANPNRHALTGITDRRGVRYATYLYDSSGRAYYEKHHAFDENNNPINVEELTIQYDPNGTTRTITNSRGKVSTYEVEDINGLWQIKSITGPGCSSCSNGNSSFDYDANSNLVSKNVDGLITKYFNYDSKGQYAYKIEAFGTPETRRIDYTYDSRFIGKVTQIKEPSVAANLFKTSDYAYNSLGQMTSRTISGYDVDGTPIQSRTTTYEYNGPFNQISQIDGPRTDVSDITTFSYYRATNPIASQKNRLKRVVGLTGIHERSGISWSDTGKITEETRPNGITITNAYHPQTDRLETTTRTSSSDNTAITTRYTYLSTGQIQSITHYDGTSDAYSMTLTYDDALRLIKVEDQLGNYMQYTLDTEGNQTFEKAYDTNGVLKKSIQQTFDDYDHLDLRTVSGISVDYNYSSDGTVDDMVNGNSITTDYSYDALKRLLQISQDHNGSNSQTSNTQTSFVYDVQDRVKEVTDARGNKTKYSYDDLGNLTKLESPDTGITTYTYDAAGNQLSQTDANGITRTMSYDANNRPLTMNYPNNSQDVGLTYDQTTNSEGLLSGFSDETGSTSINYNGFGNISSKTQSVTGFNPTTYAGFNDLTISYTFDANNRINSMTYPSGLTVNYGYDGLNQLEEIYLGSGQQTISLVDNVTYLPFGPLKGALYGNNYNYTTSYDDGYRLQNYSYFKPPSYGIGASFTYDNNNNITTINRLNVPANNYGYDALDRLTSDSAGGQTFTYDKLGNRLTHQEAGQSIVSYLYAANSNRLNQIGTNNNRIYDNNGNTLSKPDLNGVMTFNQSNRMDSYSEGTVLKGRYYYNAMGQRVLKTTYKSNGSVTGHFLYLYDEQGRLIHESKYSNGYHRWDRETIWLNNRPVAQMRTVYTNGVQVASNLYYIHVDHLNTPRWITDSAGTMIWSWESDAFGVTQPNEDADGNNKKISFNLRFPGQFYDNESGQHYNYFRDYEPQTGRYVESDPIGIFGGINTYEYVKSNPLNFIDTDGLNGHKPGGPWHPPDGTSTKCRRTDKCPQIKGKIWILEKMIKSHSGWDNINPPPKGGGRHKTEIGDLWIQLNNCRVQYALKKCDQSFCQKNVKTCGVGFAAGAAAVGFAKLLGRCALSLAGS